MFIDDDIIKFYKKYVIVGFFVVGILGTLFHFVYDWSGQAWFVGLFVPVNESTWEHMKLLFIPMLLYIASCFLYVRRKINQKYISSKKSKGIMDSEKGNSNELYKIAYTGLFGNIIGTWSIPFLFYGYMGILGFEVAWIDISTFFIAVFIAFALQYHVLINLHKKHTANCGKILLIVNMIQFFAFVLLTYRPLNLGIFISPV